MARNGRWRRGPGAELFEAARRELGALALVAEDLGLITPAVVALRERLGVPGMVVLQFAFGGGASNPHRLENHPEHAVVYPGTHDHDTALGWWSSLPARKRRGTGLDPDDPAWSLIELALSSRARLAIVAAQDVLGLGSEARLNTPGRAKGNWSWRLRRGELTSEHARRLRDATERSGRLGYLEAASTRRRIRRSVRSRNGLRGRSRSVPWSEPGSSSSRFGGEAHAYHSRAASTPP